MSNPFGESDDDVQPLPPALLLGPNPFSFDSGRDSPAARRAAPEQSPLTPSGLDGVPRSAPEPTPEPDWLRDAATILVTEASEKPWASPSSMNGGGAALAVAVHELPSPFGRSARPLVAAIPASPLGSVLPASCIAAWMVEPTDDTPPINTALVVSGRDGSPEAPDNPFGTSAGRSTPTSPEDREREPSPELEPAPEPLLALPPPRAPPLRRALSEVWVDAPTYASDMITGMGELLESGRHADLLFVAGGATLYSHRVVLEARCGRQVVQAVEDGALGPLLPPPTRPADHASVVPGAAAGVGAGATRGGAAGEGNHWAASRFSLSVGSASALRSLLEYVYTERFAPAAGSPLEVIRQCHTLDSDATVPALCRLSQLAQREAASGVTVDGAVGVAHAAAELRALHLFRFCLGFLCRHFETASQAASAGQPSRLAGLSTVAAAQLFAVRTPAPLQDAMRHGRVDAAQWLLAPDVQAWMLEGGPVSAAELLQARDEEGRTALEAALQSDDIPIATLFLESGADPSATSASGAGPLLHAVCASASRRTHNGLDAGDQSTDTAPAAGDASDVAVRQAELLLCYGASASAANNRGEAPVDAAVFSGDQHLIRLLLSHGGRSTLSTPDGGSLLHAAAAARRADVLELALPILDDLGIEIDGADAHGLTALHVAVASADASLVVPLLRARATLDIAEGGGATALQMAVEAADLRCVSALVQMGADVDVMSGDGSPMLVLAAERSVPVAMALIQASADVNVIDPAGRSALEVAVAQGEAELAELLLLRGAKPTRNQDVDGNTLLHTAVLRRSERLVSLLVKHRTELSDQNRHGCTPLLLAAESGQPSVAQTLLKAKAGLHLCDAHNRSALELALHNGHMDTLAVLLDQPNVDVNGITLRGSSLLHEAAESGDEDKVNFLLAHGAHVDVLNPNGETPLHWAGSLGHVNVVRCLTQHGADALLHERVQGLTPIHASCGPRGAPAALALLIQRCELMRWNGLASRCNVLDFARNTPLHTCARHAPHVIKALPLLLEHGADPAARNLDGQTVLHLLAERAVRTQQERSGIGEAAAAAPAGGTDGRSGDGGTSLPAEFPISRLLSMLSELPLALDAQETETGNTALHIAAFGGCISMAIHLVGLGAAVGIPNKDGFTPLDSMQPSGHENKSIAELLLSRLARPPAWVPDRLVAACQLCKLPFILAQPQRNMGNISQQFMARSQSNNVRKHHCRHCGRCVCASCSPRRAPIAKFGSAAEERVCLQCEKLLVGPVATGDGADPRSSSSSSR